jgi:hypothetical protein
VHGEPEIGDDILIETFLSFDCNGDHELRLSSCCLPNGLGRCSMKQIKHISQHETLFNEGNLMVSVAVQFSEPSNCGDERPFAERIIKQIRNTENVVLYISFRTLQDPDRVNILQPSI